MSWRSDSTQLVAGSWVSSIYPGLGILGSALASTGVSGPSAGYIAFDAGDENKEFRWVPTPPSSGIFTSNENTSFTYSGSSTSFTEHMFVDGVDLGQSTLSLTLGSSSVTDAGGIVTGEAFGSPTVTTITTNPTITGAGGIASAEAFGAATVVFSSVRSLSSAGGIASGEAFDVATVTFSSVRVLNGAGGVGTAEAFGTPTVIGSGYSTIYALTSAGGIGSEEIFGTPTMTVYRESGGLDPTTPLGKIRLKIGDYSDLPILPDSVIYAALDDCNGNVNRAASLCAQYILGTLTSKTHKKLSQLETWSGEQFDNYVKFLQMTVLNPNLSTVAPVPYSGGGFEVSPIETFIKNWRDGYLPGSIVIPPCGPGRVIEYEYT